MIRAASMVYALFIVTILTMICASFIFSFYYHNTFERSLAARTKQLSYLESGIELLKSNYKEREYYAEEKLLFESDSLSKVYLSKQSWGVYEVIHCASNTNNQTLSKSYLLGDNIEQYKDLSLYLIDNGQPLSISGETHLEGSFYLPEAGIKRAYIEGTSYRGIQLLHGETSKSQEQRPLLRKELINRIQHSQNRTALTQADSLVPASLLMELDSIVHSFAKPTIYIYSESPLTLENVSISGNVIIESDSSIVVKNTAKLNRLLLFARKISFEKQFSGNLQAFATDSILIKPECSLIYPSVVATVNKQNSGTQIIEVDSGATIQGVIIQEREKVATNDLSLVKFEETSNLTGQLYTLGKVNLGGAVWGSLICDKFTLSTSSSIYENHLLDAEINVSKRSPHYAGIHLIEAFSQGSKTILSEVE